MKATRRDEFGGNADSIAQEWADCAILLDIFARHAGIDASAKIRRKIAVLWERECKPGPNGALYRACPAIEEVA